MAGCLCQTTNVNTCEGVRADRRECPLTSYHEAALEHMLVQHDGGAQDESAAVQHRRAAAGSTAGRQAHAVRRWVEGRGFIRTDLPSKPDRQVEQRCCVRRRLLNAPRHTPRRRTGRPSRRILTGDRRCTSSTRRAPSSTPGCSRCGQQTNCRAGFANFAVHPVYDPARACTAHP